MGFLNDRRVLLHALGPAGAPLIVGLGVVFVVGASIPAATAVALGAIVYRLRSSGPGGLSGVVVPLVVFGLVVFVGHLATTAAKPLEFLARARIDGTHRARILALTTGIASVGPLEDPAVQALIRQTGAEPDHGVTTPADGALVQMRWLASLLGAVATGVVLARYRWWLVPLLLIPAVIGLYLRSREYFAAVAALRAAMREELHADVWRAAAASGAEGKDVRIFGFAEWMVRRMQEHIFAGNSPFWYHMARVARRSWIQFSLVAAGLIVAYGAVTVDAAHGRTTLAVQTTVLVAGWSLFGALGSGATIYQMVGATEVLRAYDELADALADRPATTNEPVPVPAPGDRPPAVRFEDVRFGYPNSDAVILNHLDLDIRPGELLAIVGLNGAGKSTLIKLLAGLYTPDAGRITADGLDIATIGWDAWRARMSVVFQDFVRYELSATDNVLLGYAREPFDPTAAAEAARAAGFDETLGRLPEAWQTPLARSRTGGVDLSGGQWQQVVLTRALYAVRRGARLLVLDEPTAHLDVRTEFEVFNRLARQRGDITVVLISHRLSTVREADRIVLLDAGRIAESGTHDELIALDGRYATLFRIQSERFHADEDGSTVEGGSR
jgi:ATP-binding cassette subfamily B protein